MAASDKAAEAGDPRTSIDDIVTSLAKDGYIASRRIATCMHVAQTLRRPILVEGPPGVGKTELAVATARMLGKPLIRMQCYEGIDESKALYDWKYSKQLLYTQLFKDNFSSAFASSTSMRDAMDRLAGMEDLFFSETFLEPRPLLRALQQDSGSVLLIDEVDKADEGFESLLLEILSDFQVSIPEIGLIRAKVPPLVFLTSNGARELSDALRRRCLFLHIPFPDVELEQRIVASRVPGIEADLNRQIVAFVETLRKENLRKSPSISESVDWAKTLVLLNVGSLEAPLVRETINVLLKFEQDIDRAEASIRQHFAGDS
ncbi:MoxR family ATPase [Sphingopyxis granuli]|uniref:AAA family ATPase n=1 Tax=Sphingopyxis granuli TaxID=267128 RepID=UPI001F52F305|nr:MoxR family ATPase [Sphingopyxis granuli]UNK81066.1 MoxR family ATPase [Sphingopyxis granuli]